VKWLNLEILLVQFREVGIDLTREDAAMAELRQCLMESPKSSKQINEAQRGRQLFVSEQRRPVLSCREQTFGF
jgi:hypothetical protein